MSDAEIRIRVEHGEVEDRLGGVEEVVDARLWDLCW